MSIAIWILCFLGSPRRQEHLCREKSKVAMAKANMLDNPSSKLGSNASFLTDASRGLDTIISRVWIRANVSGFAWKILR